MPPPIKNPTEAIAVADAYRLRGNQEYNYVSVSDTAKIKFFETREDQEADNINNENYEVFRLRYTDNQGLVYTDVAGNKYLTKFSQT